MLETEPGSSRSSLPPELAQLTKYEVLGELGRGGMGAVYKVREKSLGRLVALKMILGSASGQLLERFLLEARSVAKLNHPGIVPIFEIDSVGQVPYYTMAYIEGGSLAAVLESKGRLNPVGAAQVLRQVARAVDYAHQHNIIHRDLKPENILIDSQGNTRLTDFGLAKDTGGGQNMTASGVLMGTPSYMAPEQARGEARSVGPAADVYALGAILYSCLVGRPPFTGDTTFDVILKVAHEKPVPPSALTGAVPPELEAICMRCLQKDQKERFPSAAALAEAVDAWLIEVGAGTILDLSAAAAAAFSSIGPTNLGNVAAKQATVSSVAQPARRNPLFLPAVIGAGAVVVGLLVVGVFFATRPSQKPIEQSVPASTSQPTEPSETTAEQPPADPSRPPLPLPLPPPPFPLPPKPPGFPPLPFRLPKDAAR